MPAKRTVSERLGHERRGLLRSVSALLDVPMTILSFVWLVLLIVDFTGNTTETLDALNLLIWGLFILHFALEFWIAPEKLHYLRTNWLTALALVLPAFRLLRVFRAFRLLQTARVGRGVRLVRWVTSLNRGMKATRHSMRQRGLWYVVALTVLVNFVGAAGAYLFENPAALREAGLIGEASSTGIRNYGEAIWWTAMMLTTMGSDYFPKTTEGRVIAWLLAVYAFAIFGYITATVASMIIKVDRQTQSATPPPASAQDLAQEVAELQAAVRELTARLNGESLKSDAPRHWP
jgi:voltage-gated potassium channel